MVQRLRGSGATVVTTARSTLHDLRQPDLFVETDLSTPEGTEKVVSPVRDRLGGVQLGRPGWPAYAIFDLPALPRRAILGADARG
ncbi:MAG TPA: hypothetical protein VLK82_25355 [Candidatus Tectomicrobia bacterium]|nr:hypothetical protein [Candidatus Tectomicrobia bacterium]